MNGIHTAFAYVKKILKHINTELQDTGYQDQPAKKPRRAYKKRSIRFAEVKKNYINDHGSEH